MLKHSKIVEIRSKVKNGLTFARIAEDAHVSTMSIAKYSGAGTWYGVDYGPVNRYTHPYDRAMGFSKTHRNDMRRYAGDRNFVIKGLAARYNVPLNYMYHLRQEADKNGISTPRRKR